MRWSRQFHSLLFRSDLPSPHHTTPNSDTLTQLLIHMANPYPWKYQSHLTQTYWTFRSTFASNRIIINILLKWYYFHSHSTIAIHLTLLFSTIWRICWFMAHWLASSIRTFALLSFIIQLFLVYRANGGQNLWKNLQNESKIITKYQDGLEKLDRKYSGWSDKPKKKIIGNI